mgnify:CR=1 FL=1
MRLTGLSRTKAKEHEPGLVIIQIDGLSRKQMEKAISNGRLPFLDSLLKKQHYRLHSLFSGVPSTTPSVQGELFYGVKQIVPAFSFFDKKTKKIFKMYNGSAAREIEAQLKKKGGKPLLSNGSAYGDIYSGGAEETHFCVINLGFSYLLDKTNFPALIFMLVLNIYSLIRIAVLFIIELILAFYDVFKGAFTGHSLLSEIKFIPSRVGVSILLREYNVIGGKLDVARGLPVIHMDFLGYDEQAHRRGPDSRFAHWTLKGIDDAVKRVYRAAKRSRLRDYDVWIYSDHGQLLTTPFPIKHHRSVNEAIAGVFGVSEPAAELEESRYEKGIQLKRIKYIGGEWIRRFLGVKSEKDEEITDNYCIPLVTSMGPLGFIDCIGEIDPAEKSKYARKLVTEAGIPMVLIPEGEDKALVFKKDGEYLLPDDCSKVFGEEHRFLKETCDDIIKVVHHENSGDFIISCFRENDSPMTFPLENGSHGGPYEEECHAFALLPEDAPVINLKSDYIRAGDMRKSALSFLEIEKPSSKKDDAPAIFNSKSTLRVMTYNVHSCIGMDGRLSPRRVARVIDLHHPDIVALQELDVGRMRTGGEDQAHLIARYLEMTHHFHPTMKMEEELYGDAIMSRFPVRLVKAGSLPGLPGRPGLEPRGALWVEVDLGDFTLAVINTHLGLSRKERNRQVDALLGDKWLSHPGCREPAILCGDFNATPRSSLYRNITKNMTDAQEKTGKHRPRKTWFGRFPLARIDHIFFKGNIEIEKVTVPRNELTLVSSDHMPLIVDIRIPIE